MDVIPSDYVISTDECVCVEAGICRKSTSMGGGSEVGNEVGNSTDDNS